jgi:hypothetical protein
VRLLVRRVSVCATSSCSVVGLIRHDIPIAIPYPDALGEDRSNTDRRRPGAESFVKIDVVLVGKLGWRLHGAPSVGESPSGSDQIRATVGVLGIAKRIGELHKSFEGRWVRSDLRGIARIASLVLLIIENSGPLGGEHFPRSPLRTRNGDSRIRPGCWHGPGRVSLQGRNQARLESRREIPERAAVS